MDSQTASRLSTTIQGILRVEGNKKSPAYINIQNNLESILTPASHVVFGRRGTGKSALLAEALNKALAGGAFVIQIDCESLKNHHFPDVILEILRSIFAQLKNQMPFLKYPKLRHKLNKAINECNAQLSRQIEGKIKRKNFASSGAKISAKSAALSSENRSEESEEFEYSKLEEIYKRLPEWKEILKAIEKSIPAKKAWFLYIDDFYQLPSESHAEIADVIHGLCKGTCLYYKLATIQHRTRLYTETKSKPIGMQPRNDYTPLRLDFSLENFQRTSDLLWQILVGIARTCNVSEQDLETIFRGQGFGRLVWAAGGVPRDFLTSLVLYLNQLSSQDELVLGKDAVRDLAAQGFNEKMADLRRDSADNEVSVLMDLFDEIKSFCLEEKQKNLFSMNRNEESAIPNRYNAFSKLVDSRLIHLISSSRSHKSFPGEVFDIYCLDLGAYAHLRKLTGKLDEVDLTDSSPESIDLIRQAPVFPLTPEESNQLSKASGE